MKVFLATLFLNLFQLIYSQTILLNENFSTLTTGSSSGTSGPSSTQWNGNVMTFPNVLNAYPAGGMVKIGNANSNGFLESKLIDLSQNGGSFVLNFDVKGWTSIEGDIKITVTGLLPVIVSYTTVLSSSVMETKIINFSGGLTNSTIKIETTSNRAFIDNVIVSTYNLLPVEFVSFAANCDVNNSVVINWTTASEHNSDYFNLEKSRNGINWTNLLTEKAAGNSTQLINYSVTDDHALDGTNYYRLTQVDVDGSSSVYDVISTSCSNGENVSILIYPNPSNGDLTIKVDNAIDGMYELLIADLKGTTIQHQNLYFDNGSVITHLNTSTILPGVYFLYLLQEGFTVKQHKFSIE